MSDDPTICIEGLTKTYGSKKAVHALNLRVEEGTVFGFLGPNGAGKTTTIRVLLGLLRASSGSARVFGKDAWRAGPELRADVGYIPGDLRLPTHLTVLSVLRTVERIRGRQVVQRGLEFAKDYGLDPALRVAKMSRGMRQKLGLILALAHQPRLLILDEPTSTLDPVMQDLLRSQLRAFAAEGRTVFFSSHSLGEVEDLCDRVAILRRGELVTESSLEELRRTVGREVEIRWAEPRQVAKDVPNTLRIIEETPGHVRGLLTGSATPLLTWLQGQSISDLSIGAPDLERVFHAYYAESNDALEATGSESRT